jgi:hypothetical protein
MTIVNKMTTVLDGRLSNSNGNGQCPCGGNFDKYPIRYGRLQHQYGPHGEPSFRIFKGNCYFTICKNHLQYYGYFTICKNHLQYYEGLLQETFFEIEEYEPETEKENK